MKKNNKIDVSVCCLAYNHELYIRESLDSFIKQKVNFTYEIIIHDDASTDDTLKIVNEYKKKYPGLIKTIVQKENQYSKDTQSVLEILFKKAKGKYIAFCECDDYWCDENKLQRQYDYMENNPDCTLCAHAYNILQEDKVIGERHSFKSDRDILIPGFINRDTMIQSATLFFRSKDVFPLPSYYYNAKVGDIPIQLHLIEKGYCHYIDDVMSTYRYQSLGSFSAKNKGNLDRKISNHIMTCNIYQEFDEVTNNKYHNDIEKYLLNFNFNFYLSIDRLEELKKDKYKQLYKKVEFKKKIKMYLKNNKIVYKFYLLMKKCKRR